MKAVIFDLDGTLINSAISFKEMKSKIIEYLQSVGVTQGLLSDSMPNFEITSLAVKHLRQKGFSGEQIGRVLDKVTEIMNQVELASLDRATIVEGVPETLKALKAMGLKLGIMTRSCREYLEKILGRFGLEKYFDALVARDDVENPKPDPAHAFRLLRLLDAPAEQVLFVGDHWSDAECANKAGLDFVLISRSSQDIGVLERYGCQAVDSIKDIIKRVETGV